MTWILVYNRTTSELVLDASGHSVPSYEFSYANTAESLVSKHLNAGRLLNVTISFDPNGSPLGLDPEAYEAAGEVIVRNGGTWTPPPDPPVGPYTLPQVDAVLKTGRLAPGAVAPLVNGKIPEEHVPSRLTATQLEATFTPKSPTDKCEYIDAYSILFGDNTKTQILNQTGAATTCTATIDVGTTVIPFASVTNVVAGMWYVLKPGTNPQLVQVQSVLGNNVTVSPGIAQPIVSGESLYPLWTDRYHLTAGGGFKAFWNAVANAKDADGNPIFTDPGVGGRIVLLGNSWGVIGGADYTAAFQAKFPNASVELAAVSGNTSQNLLDRMDNDLTGHPAYVIFNEPGVNDVIQSVPLLAQGAQIATLARKITALGAVPVYVGPPPLRGWTLQTDGTSTGVLALSRRDTFAFGAGAGVIAETTTAPQYTVRLGRSTNGGDRTSAASRNVAIGHAAQNALTSGSDDVAVGYGAQQAIGAGVQNTAVGSSAQNAATGSFNTAVGHSAQKSQTTANLNTAVGYRSQYGPNGDVTAATTTGIHQTSVGAETGQASATPLNDITTVGYRAIAGANNATALGSGASAGHTGSVALGQGTATTDINQIEVGARHFEITEVASVPAAPAAGNARLFVDIVNGKVGLYVRFPTGVTQTIAVEP